MGGWMHGKKEEEKVEESFKKILCACMIYGYACISVCVYLSGILKLGSTKQASKGS